MAPQRHGATSASARPTPRPALPQETVVPEKQRESAEKIKADAPDTLGHYQPELGAGHAQVIRCQRNVKYTSRRSAETAEPSDPTYKLGARLSRVLVLIV